MIKLTAYRFPNRFLANVPKELDFDSGIMCFFSPMEFGIKCVLITNGSNTLTQ